MDKWVCSLIQICFHLAQKIQDGGTLLTKTQASKMALHKVINTRVGVRPNSGVHTLDKPGPSLLSSQSHFLLLFISSSSQMGMMGNPGGPFGGPYQGNQGLGGAGLGPQLQNKGPMANSLPQFNVDKKNQPMQGMASMVGNELRADQCLPAGYHQATCPMCLS